VRKRERSILARSENGAWLSEEAANACEPGLLFDCVDQDSGLLMIFHQRFLASRAGKTADHIAPLCHGAREASAATVWRKTSDRNTGPRNLKKLH